MIKSVALIKRKPGMSMEDFVKHYEEVHAPLAQKHLGLFKKYVRNYVMGVEDNDFDCISEFWFDEIEDALKVQEILGDYQTEIGKMFEADEKIFQDRDKTRMFLVDERSS